MPITRSCEDLTSTNMNTAANVSFVLDVGDNRSNSERPNTRLAARNARAAAEPHQACQLPTNDESLDRHNDDRIRQIVSDSLFDFRTDIMSSISRELGTTLRGLNLGSDRNGHNASSPEGEVTSERVSSDGRGGSEIHVQDSSERTLNIVRNWGLKFSGCTSDIDVEEFIYRVESMTRNTLGGDFYILCKYVHTLFEGRTLQWFWRYHHQHGESIIWSDLSDSLKKQYGGRDNDGDIRDEIRRRKQKYNESFDDFSHAMTILAYRLKVPMSDADL